MQRLASGGLSLGRLRISGVPLFKQLEACSRAGPSGSWLVTMGLADGQPRPMPPTLELVFTAPAKVARAGGPRHPRWRLRQSAKWLGGSRCTALSASLATRFPSGPLPYGSGRQGRGMPKRTAPCSPGAGRGARQRIPRQLAPFLVNAPGPGLLAGSCMAARALGAGAGDNRIDYVHGFPSCAGPVAAARCQLLASESNLAFAQTWVDGRIAPWLCLPPGAGATVCREGRPSCRGPGRGFRSQRCCDRAAAGLLKQEERRTIT